MSVDSNAQPRAGRRPRLVLRAVAQAALLPLFVAPFLFLPAGTLAWGMGWAVLAAFVVGTLSMSLLPALWEPELAQERLSPGPDAKAWDRRLTAWTNALLILGLPPLAGADRRFGWSAVPVVVEWTGLGVFVLGYFAIAWAMRSNPFFSALARVQTDRGHSVSAGGPYRFVRHPGYLVMCLQFLAVPFALGSWLALVPAVLAIGCYGLRTRLEDDMLREDLAGYRDYSTTVRYRLLPGLW